MAWAPILVALFAILFQFWRYKRDRQNTLIDQTIDQIRDIADDAADYWLLHRSSVDAEPAAKILEAKIRGNHAILRQYVVQTHEIIRRRWSSKDADLRTLDEADADFIDATTGGTFTEAEAVPEPARAQRSKECAAQLMVKLREMSM